MREKLIELLSYFGDGYIAKNRHIVCDTKICEIADHLIANDVVPVVRCKDCEKWQRHTQVDRERGHCRRFDITKHESGFCDRGERRTDAETD